MNPNMPRITLTVAGDPVNVLLSDSTGRVAAAPSSWLRRNYLTMLKWSFTLFNSCRVFAYLPTMWAIHTSGDSHQHSLWTWCIWLGANATMAACVYDTNGCRMDRIAAVSTCNAIMCLAGVVMILAYRI